MKKVKLLFVCTGNTCRSPMAQALAEAVAKEKGIEVSCRSAGLFAREGAPMAENARRVLEKLGVAGFTHTAEPLTKEQVEEADLVIGMTPDHAAYIRQLFGHPEKVLSLPVPVGDPYGGGMAEYETAARAIREGLEKMCERGLIR